MINIFKSKQVSENFISARTHHKRVIQTSISGYIPWINLQQEKFTMIKALS